MASACWCDVVICYNKILILWYNIIIIMYSQEPIFTTPESLKKNRPPGRRWYKKWWGQLALGVVGWGLVLAIALVIYILKLTFLLGSGQITTEDLFGPNIEDGSVVTNQFNLATEDDPSIGPKDAKVVVVEFSDFQCPYCAEVYPVIKELARKYKDQVLFVYRDFPLIDTHPQATLAALAANCSQEQGKFWEMHDRIFENQDKLNEVNLASWAVQIGLNSLQFSSCMGSGKYLPEIEADLQEGIAFGVEATPTFFINGRILRGAQSLATFESIILAELTR